MSDLSYLSLDNYRETVVTVSPLFDCEPPSSRTLLTTLVALVGLSLLTSGILAHTGILKNLGASSVAMTAVGFTILLGLIIYSCAHSKNVTEVEVGIANETGLWEWESCNSTEFASLIKFIPEGRYLTQREDAKLVFFSTNGNAIKEEEIGKREPIFLSELRLLQRIPKKEKTSQASEETQIFERMSYSGESAAMQRKLEKGEYFWGMIQWGNGKPFEESICFFKDDYVNCSSKGDDSWPQALTFKENSRNRRVDLQTLSTRP